MGARSGIWIFDLLYILEPVLHCLMKVCYILRYDGMSLYAFYSFSNVFPLIHSHLFPFSDKLLQLFKFLKLFNRNSLGEVEVALKLCVHFRKLASQLQVGSH